VGFALSRGSGEILSIFALLGLGLAFPYLLVSAFPGIARILPRPGSWMLWVKRVLALALLGTAIWLVTVLVAQIGLQAGLVVAVGLSLLAGAMVLRRYSPKLRRGASVLAGLVALAAVATPLVLAQAPANAIASDYWQDFDLGRLAELVAEEKVVLVDVTADWCLTCQVNEKLVLGRGDVQERFDNKKVVAMRGDWTLPDEVISRFLADHGRYGIPFNAVYGPGAPDGLVLPELLTRDALFEALDKAGRRQEKPALTAGDS
jgi:suppressor for copper-sensitivity B